MTATTTKERPVIFSGPMVRAILDSLKTQTRRVVKNSSEFQGVDRLEDGWRFWWDDSEFDSTEVTKRVPATACDDRACPYGVPGDRLWVRENFNWGCDIRSNESVKYVADGTVRAVLRDNSGLGDPIATTDPTSPFQGGAIRPSIHMPRWASRILLEVTDVRVERLQEITPDDIAAEGFPPDNSPPHDGTRLTSHGRRLVFAETWDDINKKRGFGWVSNPWVWVVEFKRIDT